jgi:dihydrofolate reductase
MTPRIRASVFVGVSVDGFLARRDGALDFLPEEPEEHGYVEFMKTVDAIVVGRNTYEVVLAFEGWAYAGKKVFVLSSRPIAMPRDPDASVERLEGDPASICRTLAERGFRHLYVDGGITIQRFLAARMIQRMTVTRVPVLIGEGIPLFGSLPEDVRLKHVETRSYPSGLVTSVYDIGA